MALLKDSLIAHYKMNDNLATAVVIDETGIHNGEYQLNSVAQNTDTGNETGKILGALDFIGGANGEHIEIADHVDFSPGNSVPGSGKPFSISVWVNMHDATSFMIASKGVFWTNIEWIFRTITNDQVYFQLYDQSTGASYLGRRYSVALTSYENTWIHLVTTYDGGTLESGIGIYLNGVKVDDFPGGADQGSFIAVENLNAPIYIGRYSTVYANGLIDNMMFFNKELTPLEVKYLYNGGAGVESIPTLIEMSRTGYGLSSQQEI